MFFAYGCFEHILALLICLVLCISGVLAKQGTPTELINALPVHQFKRMKDTIGNGTADSSYGKGVVAAGTDMERVLEGEDAVSSPVAFR